VGSFVSTTEGAGEYTYTHYVAPYNGGAGPGTSDTDAQNATAFANASNILTPCTIACAFANATAGDTIAIRGGTYEVGSASGATYVGCLNFANDGIDEANRIIIAAYTGESPTINGEKGTTGPTGNTGTPLGTILIGMNKEAGWGANYITIDGIRFTSDSGTSMAVITAAVSAGDQDWQNAASQVGGHITIKRCIFEGGTDLPAPADNFAAIYCLRYSWMIVEDCLFKDYTTSDPRYPHAWQSYYSHFGIFRNNEVVNCNQGVYFKSGNHGWQIYNNFFHNLDKQGIEFGTNVNYFSTMQVWNNIFYDCRNGGISSNETDLGSFPQYTGDDMQYWNNTIVRAATQDTNNQGAPFGYLHRKSTGHPNFRFYNNILSNRTIWYNAQFDQDVNANPGFFDNNIFYSQIGGGVIRVWKSLDTGGTNYSNFADFLNATVCGLAPGQHNQASLTTAPVFVNANGNFSEPSDFLLDAASPGKNAGIGGIDIGADTTTVGIGNG
jgi:hypothetical protein